MAERKRRHGKLYLLLMALAAAGAAIWVGSSVLSVEEFAFTGARLPAGWDGGRLVVLSDLHGKRFGRQNSRLLEAVRGAKPDVICLCGDMMDEWSGTEYLRPLLEGLVEIAPVYYVTGNHESRIPQAFAQLEERMAAAGAQILRNQSLYWEREGQRVRLIGLDDPSFLVQESQLEDHLHSLQDEDCYQILLSHRPELFDVYAAAGVDLSLTGHAHGGAAQRKAGVVAGGGNVELGGGELVNRSAGSGCCVGDQIGHGLGVAGAAPIDNCDLAHK